MPHPFLRIPTKEPEWKPGLLAVTAADGASAGDCPRDPGGEPCTVRGTRVCYQLAAISFALRCHLNTDLKTGYSICLIKYAVSVTPQC